jgi:two-component system chemotaxis response regulator CheY
VARGLLNTVLLDGGYDVVGQGHTCASGMALMVKYQPQMICMAREQMESDPQVLREIRSTWPKSLIFMVSSEFDAATVQAAHAMGVNGFIVKPFKADTVLNTIRNTVIAMVKRQRAALAAQNDGAEGEGEAGEGPSVG